MKWFKQIIVFSLILIIQSFTEATIYQLYRYAYLQMKAADLISSFFRYSIYRLTLAFIPYIILTSIAFNSININKNKSFLILKLGVINLIVNLLIVGFIGFYLEPILFDEKIFYCTVISGLLLLIIAYKIKAKRFTIN